MDRDTRVQSVTFAAVLLGLIAFAPAAQADDLARFEKMLETEKLIEEVERQASFGKPKDGEETRSARDSEQVEIVPVKLSAVGRY